MKDTLLEEGGQGSEETSHIEKPALREQSSFPGLTFGFSAGPMYKHVMLSGGPHSVLPFGWNRHAASGPFP